jgi:hypothetical protein
MSSHRHGATAHPAGATARPPEPAHQGHGHDHGTLIRIASAASGESTAGSDVSGPTRQPRCRTPDEKEESMKREFPLPVADAQTPQALHLLWIEWTRSLLRTNQMPLSGNVDQWIRSWGEAVGQVGLLNVNIAGTSNPELEEEITSKYSYGRQLGRILEVLAPLVERSRDQIEDKSALADFQQMVRDISKLKRLSVDDVVAEVTAWQKSPGFKQELEDLLRQLTALAGKAE